MIAMIWHSIYALTLILSGEQDYYSEYQDIKKLKIAINIYLLIVIMFHCPIVLLQDYS